MTAVTRAFVGLGGNLGDVPATIASALDALGALPGTRLVARSRLYHTPPWGPVPQPDFVNAAAALDTTLTPRALLDHLLAIERAHGRVRDGERWGPRSLDLDLLLHGEACLEMDGLSVPHPRLAERAFVLLPLHDLDPDLGVPGRGRVRELLAAVDTKACQALDDPA